MIMIIMILRRDTASVHWQETLNALHRECNDLLEMTQQQAKVSEDDLARSSFKIAELESLLADYKLRADDAKVRHERELYQSRADLVTAMCELHEEKKRSSQKNRQINDLKEKVAALKAGGDCFDSRDVEAQELGDFRIAELEILLEEKRDENTMLRAQLLSEEEKRLTAEMLLSSSSTQEQEMGKRGGLGQSVLRKAGKMLSLIDKLRRSSVPRKHEKVLFKIGKKFLGLQSQGEAAFSSHLRRDTASVHWQETLNALHRQAKVSEDDLARSSFKIAELEILLADCKLELYQSRADLVTSAQKNQQINDLKEQVVALKAGGDFRDVEAQELSEFRIAELEILLEEQRDENTLLRAQLLSEEEKSLTVEMLSSSSAQEQEMGKRRVPVLGHLLALGRAPHLKLAAWRRQYGDVFTVRMGMEDVVVLNGYTAVKDALVDRSELFASTPPIYLLDAITDCGKDIIVARWGTGFRQRKRFATTVLRDLGMKVGRGSIEEKIREEADCLRDRVAENNGEPFNIAHDVAVVVANVICSMAFGKRYDYEDETFRELREAVVTMLVKVGLGQIINVFPLLRFVPVVNRASVTALEAFYKVRNVLTEEISRHREYLDRENPRDFLDFCLLELEQQEKVDGLTEENVMYMTANLFVAGTDTTTNTLLWSLLYMTLNPDIQHKAQQELDAVVGEGLPTLSHRSQLPYVNACLLEAIRIRTIGPMARHATTQEVNVQGYNIPNGIQADVCVLVSSWPGWNFSCFSRPYCSPSPSRRQRALLLQTLTASSE
ncbi:CYP2U1 [Branchiostoma lanceolatum]|nr:CYP2U1 [Branchiostoma lanceolatum]